MTRPSRSSTARSLAAATRIEADAWLTLGEASELLGVHVSTLRRWSDTGRVSCRRTAGHHRRFSRREILRLADRGAPDSRRTSGYSPVHTSWHAAFENGGVVAPSRALGQRLAGVLVQFLLGTDPPRHMADARGIGREYAAICRESGVTMSEAVQAFLFYRARFTDALGQYANEEELLERHRRYDAFVGEVLLGLVEDPGDAAAAV